MDCLYDKMDSQIIYLCQLVVLLFFLVVFRRDPRCTNQPKLILSLQQQPCRLIESALHPADAL
jgi:hypothetical protein